MRETHELFGTVVRCDVEGCPERFYSYSMPSVVRKQAKLAGWWRGSARKVLKPDGEGATYAGTSRKLVDVCPSHRPTTARMPARANFIATGALVALAALVACGDNVRAEPDARVELDATTPVGADAELDAAPDAQLTCFEVNCGTFIERDCLPPGECVTVHCPLGDYAWCAHGGDGN